MNENGEENKKEEEEKEKKSGLLAKILFAIAGIIIIILIALSIIILVPRLFSSVGSTGNPFSKLFGNKTELSVKANLKEVKVGDPIILSLEDTYEKPHYYTVEYSCKEGFIMGITTNVGLRSFECEKPLPIGNAKEIKLIPDLKENNSFYDVTITVSLVDAETKSEEYLENTLVTVIKGDPSSVSSIDGTDDSLFGSSDSNEDGENTSTGFFGNTSNNNNNSPSYSETASSSYYDPVTGLTFSNTGGNGSTANTAPTTSYNSGTQYGNTTNTSGSDLRISNINSISGDRVTFTVSNIGGSPSGSWYFTYTTPTNTNSIEKSPFQLSLNPGESMLVTIDFDDTDNGIFNVSIDIDPDNRTRDINRSNNYGSTYISSSYTRINYGSSAYYPSYSSVDGPDLEIIKLEAGYLSRSGKFIKDSTIDEDDDAAIRFCVINRGDESTGSWRYEINVSDGDDERSSRQSSIRPNESVEIIAELNLNADRRQRIEVEVDYRDEVDEYDERNNKKEITIRVDD